MAQWVPLNADLPAIVERARDRGEISPTADAGLLMEMLISPLVVRTVLLRTRITEGFLERLVRTIVRAAERP